MTKNTHSDDQRQSLSLEHNKTRVSQKVLDKIKQFDFINKAPVWSLNTSMETAAMFPKENSQG